MLLVTGQVLQKAICYTQSDLDGELAVDPLRWFSDFAMAFFGCRTPAVAGAGPDGTPLERTTN